MDIRTNLLDLNYVGKEVHWIGIIKGMGLIVIKRLDFIL
jgi:hypothetical protein